MRTPWAIVLFVVFLVLKLARIGDVATWSWWWVFAPLIVWFVLVLVMVAMSEDP